MNIIDLECRDCESAVKYTSDFMADEKPQLHDVQDYIDLFFLASCGVCYSRNWLVTSVKPATCPHGHLDIVA